MQLKRLAATLLFISSLSSAARTEPLPTLALTFDHYRSTYDVAFPIMKRHGLVGTFYVDTRYVDDNGGVTSEELRQMQQAGWEIGAYSGWSLYEKFVEDGEQVASDDMAAMSINLALKGFTVTSLAPAGRAWSKRLGVLSRPYFDNVRVIDLNYGRQRTITDPHFIRNGWTPTLSAEETSASLDKLVDDLASAGGMQTLVAHEIGANGSMSAATFERFCRKLASTRAQGKLAVTTFSEAVSRWSKPTK